MMPHLLLVAALLVPALFATPGPGTSREKPPGNAGTEQVRVNLVLIDLLVRDRKDQPVSGLRLEDFDLLIDGARVAPSDIESFEEVCAAPAGITGTMAPAAGPLMAPRHIVMYFDFEQMTMAGRRLSLKSARDFVSSRLNPSDRVLIVTHRRRLRVVQDFTSDAANLTSRMDELLADNSPQETDATEESGNMEDVSSRPCIAGECPHRVSAAMNYAAKEQMRARRSLTALESLMPALAAIKGRKALVLFTDVLRAEPGIQYFSLARVDGRSHGMDIAGEMVRLTREANASGVSFYTVHAGGLDDSTMDPFRDRRGAEITLEEDPKHPGLKQKTLVEQPHTDLAPSSDAIGAGRASSVALQVALAEETGGRALQRTNDVGAILDSASRDLSCYYLLGYRHDGRADDARHSIQVRIKPGRENGNGLRVRFRPYYNDISVRDRTDRLARSALSAPDLFEGIPVSVEAFVLAPSRSGSRILFKAIVPLAALTLLPAGDGFIEGRALVRGEVTRGDEVVCDFAHDLPVKVTGDPAAKDRLVYETGCLLDPGVYSFGIAVLDPVTMEAGARRASLSVPSAAGAPHLSEVQVWALDPQAELVIAGVGVIGLAGLADGRAERAVVPISQRRLRSGQAALLSFLLCPGADGAPMGGNPIRVHREMKGEGGRTVSGFKEMVLGDPPDPETGCYQLVTAIPAGMLGDGVYTLTIEATGGPFDPPISRDVDLAVN